MEKTNKITAIIKKQKDDRIYLLVIALFVLIDGIDSMIGYINMADKVYKPLSRSLHDFALVGIIFTLWLVVMEVKKNRKPITKGIATKMHIISFLTFVASFIPEMVSSIITDFIVTGGQYINPDFVGLLSSSNFLALILAGVIGTVTELLKYGAFLQEDSELIA